MISGGFFGGVLGFIAGITIYGAMKLSGVTMQEVYEACQIYYKMKDFYFHDTHKVNLYKSTFKILCINST